MKTMPYPGANVEEVVKVLQGAGLVIMPTETVYGAMVDATNTQAVAKLTEFKKRPLGKPYSVAVDSLDMAEQYVELNETARNLYHTFLPGPLTVISQGKHNVARGVESETGTLGVRIPDHPFVLEVVQQLGKPITATSANPSYQKRPYKISDVWEVLSDKQKSLVDLIIDAGDLPRNEPSTVVDTTLDDTVVLRQGDLKLKDEVEILTTSEEGTMNFGKELWHKFGHYHPQRAIVFALEGPMGTGKTILTKGIGRAMGLSEEVVSPTFNLELEYDKTLVHIDAWRMEGAKELESLGFGNRISDHQVVVVEWADRVVDAIRSKHEDALVVWVKIVYGKKESERIIRWGTL